MGGEVYQIIKAPRLPFYAAADDIYAFQNEQITLIAADIGEPAVYNWYNQSGVLVHEGLLFPTIALTETTYKLEVIAEADGYKDYAEATVRIVPGKIEELYPNPTSDMVTVTCVFNNVSNASLVITDYFGNIYLITSHQSVDFNTHNYPIGTYVVKLICDGQLADVKTFVKQ